MNKFSDIIGQDIIVSHLQNAMRTGGVSHAYILNGARGSGRHMIARSFAAALLCEDPQKVRIPQETTGREPSLSDPSPAETNIDFPQEMAGRELSRPDLSSAETNIDFPLEMAGREPSRPDLSNAETKNDSPQSADGKTRSRETDYGALRRAPEGRESDAKTRSREDGGAADGFYLEPCGRCLSCLQAASGSNPDLITLEREKENSIGVGDIRKMRADVQILPYSASHKIYIIPDAEKMTPAAQNALLKTLEEPPSYAVLLLLADGTAGFLPTILSRCITLPLRPVAEKAVEQCLRDRFGADPQKARLCARFSGGSIGRAALLLENESFAALRDRTISFLREIGKTDAADIASFAHDAAAENQTAQNVELEFYPGFTAFEFTLNAADTELILKELVLSPANTDKSLAGEVAVNTIQTGGATFSNTANYTITYPESKKTTYTFPDNTIISETEYVTFTVFAVPEKIEGLTLEFHMGEDGSEIQTATLKQRVNGEKQDITFTGGKKHCLRGIAVKGVWEFTYLTLDIKPLGWEPVQSDISSGDGVQATQFNIVGADNLRELKDDQVNADTAMTETEKAEAKEANKAYRQWWVFDAGETVTVTYKIMMPLVGTWTVEPCGDTGSFTVTSSTGALTGDLAGEEASATYINLTITSNATGQKSLYLKTSVTTSNGETYSLDSETQLYDMRGYHYFIVNGTVDTEAL